MLRHKTSSTLKSKNRRYSQRHNRQLINILTLSVMWTMLFTETMALPSLKPLLSSNKPTTDVIEQQEHIYLDEKLFNKLQKYHNKPNFLKKWPGLRDLVLTLDYDNNNGVEENDEFVITTFVERLRQLGSSKWESYDDNIHYDNGDINLMSSESFKSSGPLSTSQLSFKDHNIKKNVQYMSPCHFKICNMGRKRFLARFLKNY